MLSSQPPTTMMLEQHMSKSKVMILLCSVLILLLLFNLNHDRTVVQNFGATNWAAATLLEQSTTTITVEKMMTTTTKEDEILPTDEYDLFQPRHLDMVHDDSGCQVRPTTGEGPPKNRTHRREEEDGDDDNDVAAKEEEEPSSEVTGIAIVLAKRMNSIEHAVDTMDLLCSKLGTQLAYFYEPQHIDVLVLVELYGISYQHVADCLELIPLLQKPTRSTTSNAKNNGGRNDDDNVVPVMHYWKNLDGTSLTGYEYRTKIGGIRVFLAPYVMSFPKYIVGNHQSIANSNFPPLHDDMEDCNRPPEFKSDYIQGTRFYMYDVFQFELLKYYDYFLKIDLDIEFHGDQNRIVPFNMLHDMKIKKAVFGHTAEWMPHVRRPRCAKHYNVALNLFLEEAIKGGGMVGGEGRISTLSQPPSVWATSLNWTRPCSANVVNVDQIAYDWYYTNFIILSTSFFQSEPVRSLGEWLREFYPGFFRFGWTDQTFFHVAMAFFLGPDFRTYVADYTDLRCRRFSTCWLHYGSKLRGEKPVFCMNNGSFIHGKNRKAFGKPFDGVYPNITVPKNNTPYVDKYINDCHGHS